MAERITLYWRDIPAQIIIRKGRATEKRELPERFIRAIDACAMRVGAKDGEAYLSQWRRGTPQPCSDDLAVEADAAIADLVQSYDDDRLKALVRAEGFDPARTADKD